MTSQAEKQNQIERLRAVLQLNAGVRQVATALEGIRYDHRARYEWVAGTLNQDDTVVDYGCGIGYGSVILAERAASVLGVDYDSDALEFARLCWARDNVTYAQHDLTGAPVPTEALVAVAFEVVEHLDDPETFLKNVQARSLYVSVPNEQAWAFNPAMTEHRRHYTQEELTALLRLTGWKVLGWYGQLGTHNGVAGLNQLVGPPRTLIAWAIRQDGFNRHAWLPDDQAEALRQQVGPYDRRARRRPPPSPAVAAVEVAGTDWPHPTGRTPETVMLCALGASKYELMETFVVHGFNPPWHELWTVNKGAALLPQADVTFVMDDIYEYTLRRPIYREQLERFVSFGGKVVGQTLSHECPIPYTEYPLRQVLEFWGEASGMWLHTISMGYILAYAGFIGVKRLMLAGVDCNWPNRPDLVEAGAGVVCYWLGRLEGLGVEVLINSSSVLNEANKRDQYGFKKFYGYLMQPAL